MSLPQGVSVGVVMPQSSFRFEGKAQQQTDIGGMGDNVRICGTDLFSTPVMAGSTDSGAGFGGTATYFAKLTPGFISTRLANLEELFQYYAIREIQVMYSPEVATTKSVSLALGVIQETTEVEFPYTTITQQQVLELTPAMKLPAYQVASIVYKHSGMQLWSTSTSKDAETGATQISLACSLTGADLAVGVQYGSLWLSYVIDFYKPSPVLASPARLRARADRLEEDLKTHGRSERKVSAQVAQSDADSKATPAEESKGERRAPGGTVKVRAHADEYELVSIKPDLPSVRAQGREAGSKDDTGTGWFRKG
jgi:hypothetical protein